MWNMGHDARAEEQRFFHVPMKDTCEVSQEADSGVEPRRRRNALADHPTRRIATGAPRRPASADAEGLSTVPRPPSPLPPVLIGHVSPLLPY
jgi:hypothetical protein